MMKATVFSKFPPRYFEETIHPKLKEYGVDVLRVVNPDRTPSCDVSACEVVIALRDMMSHQDTANIRKLSRQYNKRYIALERKEASWQRELSALQQAPVSVRSPANDTARVPSLTLVTAPPPSEPEAEEPELGLEEQLVEVRQLLKLYEDESEVLEGEKTDLIGRLKSSDNLASGLEKQLETMTRERDKWANLAESMETAAKNHQGECLKLQITVRNLETQLASKASDVFSEALAHFKALRKLGFMTNEEIIEKILKD